MSIFILVVNEGALSLPSDNQRCSNNGYKTRHGPFNTYVKYHCSKLEHAIVINIWNIDARQRLKYLTPAVSCYFMSLPDKVTYLLDIIMLLSQTIATMIPTVKFENYNTPFTIEDILKGEFNWNLYEITPPCYVIKICILYRLYFKQHDFLKEEVIVNTHANFHHATGFTFIYSIVYSGADQRKHQSSASLAFVWWIHRWPVTSPHKRPVTWNMFHLIPYDMIDLNIYEKIYETRNNLTFPLRYYLMPLSPYWTHPGFAIARTYTLQIHLKPERSIWWLTNEHYTLAFDKFSSMQ